jgi:hypothetical protein
MRLFANKIAMDLAAYQRLAAKHKLNICWHLPHGVPLKRDSTSGGVTQAFPAGKVWKRETQNGTGMMVKPVDVQC